MRSMTDEEQSQIVDLFRQSAGVLQSSAKHFRTMADDIEKNPKINSLNGLCMMMYGVSCQEKLTAALKPLGLKVEPIEKPQI